MSAAIASECEYLEGMLPRVTIEVSLNVVVVVVARRRGGSVGAVHHTKLAIVELDEHGQVGRETRPAQRGGQVCRRGNAARGTTTTTEQCLGSEISKNQTSNTHPVLVKLAHTLMVRLLRSISAPVYRSGKRNGCPNVYTNSSLPVPLDID